MSSSQRLPAKPVILGTQKRKSGDSNAPNTPTRRLYVGHIPAHINEYALTKHFTNFGKVRKVDYLYNTQGMYKGRPRGYGFVEYERVIDAVTAKEVSHLQVFNRQLVVEYTREADSDVMPTKRRRKVEHEYTELSLRKAAATPTNLGQRIEQMQNKLNGMENGTEGKKNEQDKKTSKEGE